jgi:hypothetical protein
MVRPCVARGFRRSVGCAVLHQCIRPLIGAFAPGHHGYQRACVLISGQASTGPSGSPGFACAGKTVLHLVSISRRPRRETGCDVMSSLAPYRCSSFVRAMRPFLRPGLRLRSGRRAQGPSRLAVALGSPQAPSFPGHALTAPSTVPRFKQLGTSSYLSWRIRICVPC